MLADRIRAIRAARLSHLYKASEVDAQVLLIEPVLAQLRWPMIDPTRVRRGDRDYQGGARQKFDLELWTDDRLRAVIECKSLETTAYLGSEDEFRAGRFGYSNRARIRGRAKWIRNKNCYGAVGAGDGTAQVRVDCLNFRVWHEANPDATNPQPWVGVTPVLTNGEKWIVFNGDRIFDDERAGYELEQADVAWLGRITEDCSLCDLRPFLGDPPPPLA